MLRTVLLSCLLVACTRAKAPESKADPAPVAAAPAAPKPGAVPADKAAVPTKFGASITEATTTPLDALVKEPATYKDKVIKTEGKITAVCQEMGCWMEIGDPAGGAHIKMAGESFYVPKDASGRRAIVQGKVLGGDKDNTAKEAEEATGHVAKIQIEASGVELVD
jgi:hypothetical protein